MAKKKPAKLGPQKPITVAPSPITRKIDLACGQRPKDGFEGLDIWPQASIVHDLTIYPWPFADNSVAELHCSHYAEHIAMMNVDRYGNRVARGGQDALFKFFDECWRVLMPDGWLEVIVPSGRSNRAFQDPTHRRFFVEATFAYFHAPWRIANALNHYNVECDFDTNVQTTVDVSLNAMHPEASARHMHSYWNSTVDFHARMKAVKPARLANPTP